MAGFRYSACGLFRALGICLYFVCGAVAAQQSATARPDYETIERALDGNEIAIATLLDCAEQDSDCRAIAAAALHRAGRTDDAIALLRPRLKPGRPQVARTVAELAFERKQWPLVWAAARLWADTAGVEPPDGEVDSQGVRMTWLMGQSLTRMSDAELAEARSLAGQLLERPPAESEPPERSAVQEPVERAFPTYPGPLAMDGAGGWAYMVYSIDRSGQVDDVQPLFASHPAFAKASAEALGRWRYPAAERARWKIITMEFALSGGPARPKPVEDGTGRPDANGWIRFDDSRGWIEFTVFVNGIPVRAILDSGAQGHSISRRLAERAGIDLIHSDRIRIRGVYGEQVVPESGPFELQFGSAKATLSLVPVLPSTLPDVVLGVSLFHVGVVQIDYPRKRIRFFDRKAVDFDGNVKMRTEGGASPQVATEIDGKRVWMLFDTGKAGPTLLKRSLVQRLELAQYEVPDHPGWVGFGAVSGGRMRALQIPGFQLGPFPFEWLLASYIEEGAERGFEARETGYGSRIQRDSARYDGILGTEVLKNFIVTVDVKRRKIHFALPPDS